MFYEDDVSVTVGIDIKFGDFAVQVIL